MLAGSAPSARTAPRAHARTHKGHAGPARTQVRHAHKRPSVRPDPCVVQLPAIAARRRPATRRRTESIRTELRDLSITRLITRLAGFRARVDDDQVASSTRAALKRLAVRIRQLDEDITAHDTDLAQLVDTVNPTLVLARGIATVTAAQLQITAGDHPDRIRSEAAFAILCGASPLPASSGKTTRHRLNRGSDSAANCALRKIAIVRLATDPETRAHATRRTAEGKTKKDILRCLKRAIACEVFHLFTTAQPAAHSSDLRPARKRLGLSLARDCTIRKTPLIERGTIRDTRFLHRYQAWLNENHPHQITA
ncbi:MAG: transposase [Actinomycetota bacterium]